MLLINKMPTSDLIEVIAIAANLATHESTDGEYCFKKGQELEDLCTVTFEGTTATGVMVGEIVPITTFAENRLEFDAGITECVGDALQTIADSLMSKMAMTTLEEFLSDTIKALPDTVSGQDILVAFKEYKGTLGLLYDDLNDFVRSDNFRTKIDGILAGKKLTEDDRLDVI